MAEEISNQGNQPLSADDILDVLNVDDENPEETNEPESEDSETDVSLETEDDSDTSDDGESEGEDTDTESEDEPELDEDEVDFHTIPRRAEILKQYPDLFKKFPAIERSIYRDQQYSELFPSLGAAKEAKEELNRFNALKNDLFNGELAPTLAVLKKADNGSFEKISENILEILHKVDEGAYQNVLERVLRTAIYNANQTGKRNNNEQLEIAAEILNKWLFETDEIKPYERKTSNAENPKEAELRQREIQFAQQQLETAVNDVGTRVQNVISNSIEKFLDPKGVLPPYIQRKAKEDILVEVNKAIQSDKRTQEVLNILWRRAGSDGYSDASKLRIRNALLSRAQAVLPDIMRKIKSEALKGTNIRVRKAEKKETRSSLPDRKDVKKPEKNMSTLDFLNSD